MKKLIIPLILLCGGCETVNLSKTVAGGACGAVDYSIIFMGAPLVGVKADRECVEAEEE